jgi:iron complex transport system permease protein
VALGYPNALGIPNAARPRPSSSMTVLAAPRPVRAPVRAVGRSAGLLVALGVLVVAVVLSLAIGARQIPLGEVVDVLQGQSGTRAADVVNDVRLPRTILVALVGATLGLAGGLMQALTRNPLADPGLLGVNAGASAAVVTAIGLLGITSATGYVWFAFAGAALASVLVFAIGSMGRGGATPVRLASAGTALTAAFIAYIYAVTLTDPFLLQRYNAWSVGSFSGRGYDEVRMALPFIALGALIAFLLARTLNAMALGDDSARSLGAHAGRARIAGAVAITLLAGAATAAAGPIAFVGLTVPHVARALTGSDQRWVLTYSVVLGAILVLCADVLGRVLARPSEVQAAIVMAFIGVPVFIAVIRRRSIGGL